SRRAGGVRRGIVSAASRKFGIGGLRGEPLGKSEHTVLLWRVRPISVQARTRSDVDARGVHPGAVRARCADQRAHYCPSGAIAAHGLLLEPSILLRRDSTELAVIR